VISGFCCEVGELCTLLGCYTVHSANYLPPFQDNIQVPSQRIKKSWSGKGKMYLDFLTLEDGTDRFSPKVCKELSLYAAKYPRRAQIS